MASTYTPIATATLGSANSTISFTSIPSSYTDLKLIVTGTITSGTGVYGLIRLNSDSTATYSQTIMYGDGTSALHARYTTTSAFPGIVCNSGGYSTTIPFFVDVNLFNYNSSAYKGMLIKTHNDLNTSSANPIEVSAGLWNNTSAVTAMSFVSSSSTFAAGSTATLYGILKA